MILKERKKEKSFSLPNSVRRTKVKVQIGLGFLLLKGLCVGVERREKKSYFFVECNNQ